MVWQVLYRLPIGIVSHYMNQCLVLRLFLWFVLKLGQLQLPLLSILIIAVTSWRGSSPNVQTYPDPALIMETQGKNHKKKTTIIKISWPRSSQLAQPLLASHLWGCYPSYHISSYSVYIYIYIILYYIMYIQNYTEFFFTLYQFINQHKSHYPSVIKR